MTYLVYPPKYNPGIKMGGIVIKENNSKNASLFKPPFRTILLIGVLHNYIVRCHKLSLFQTLSLYSGLLTSDLQVYMIYLQTFW